MTIMSHVAAPLVSIIIPNYNYAPYLGEAIDSALAQTHQPVEVIVVDDGSTDASRSVIQRYGDAIQAVFQSNAGVSSARNAAIARARGAYVLFLDSDDVLLPGACATLLNAFSERPECGVIFGQAQRVDAQGILFGIHANESRYFGRHDFLWGNPMLVPAEALVARKVLDEIGGFNPAFLQGEDYDFWIRTAERFPIFHIPVTVVNARAHSDNLTRNKVKQLTWEFQVRLAHHDGSWLMRRSLAEICHRLAYEHRITHEKSLFRRYTLASLCYNPLYWKNYAYLIYSGVMRGQ